MNFLEVDADVAYDLMKALEIPKYSLLGWSNGGITSLIISGKHPESIDTMIIFGAIAYMTPREIRVYDFVVDVRNWADHIRKPKEELYGFEYFQKKYTEDVEMVKKIYKENDGNICREFLKTIEAETLILHGEKDLMVSKEHVPYLLQNIKNSELINFPNGAHDIHIKYPNEFNKHVKEFLKR